MRILRRILAVMAMAGAGCGVDGSAEIPFEIGLGPIISNQPDTFAVEGIALLYTGTQTHSWTCSSDQAEIGFLSGLAEGSVRLQVFDAVGELQHDNTYQASMEGATFVQTRPGGVPGPWTLRFDFLGAMWYGAIVIFADTNHSPDSILIGGRYSLDSSLTYEMGWPAGPAEVTVGSALSFGAIRIRIWDPLGVLVMDQIVSAPLASAYGGQSAPGPAGIWRVTLDIDATALAAAIGVSHSGL